MNLRSNTHRVTSATKNVPRSSLYKAKKRILYVFYVYEMIFSSLFSDCLLFND